MRLFEKKQWLTMSDEDFCRSLGLQDDLKCRLCILIRKESAKWFYLKPERVLADSLTMPLNNRAWTPFIVSDIIPQLEIEISKWLRISLQIDDSEFEKLTLFTKPRLSKRKYAETFGQWALELTEFLAKKVHEIKES